METVLGLISPCLAQPCYDGWFYTWKIEKVRETKNYWAANPYKYGYLCECCADAEIIVLDERPG
ncbi:hypothetical protein [Paenibacillus sp. GCM10028914]|uniref:hypothetical protein n=1 Tax=Paenibacillus sp. GCM10028914 TaxID=3273416 RepID=UPI0036212714